MRRAVPPPCTSDPLVRQGKPNRHTSRCEIASRNRCWNSHRPAVFQPEFMEDVLNSPLETIRPKTRCRTTASGHNFPLTTYCCCVLIPSGRRDGVTARGPDAVPLNGYRNVASRNFSGQGKFPNRTKMTAQAKFPDTVNIPDKPLPAACRPTGDDDRDSH